MLRYILALSFCVIASLGISIDAQTESTDVSQVSVSALSDEQLEKILNEMEKRGLNKQQVISLARAKGMTTDQIQELEGRLEEYIADRRNEEKEIQKDDDLFMQSELSEKVEEDLVDDEMERVFGFSLFNSNKLTFEPNLNTPVSDSYILGPGDEILISIWGRSEQNYQLLISKAGSIVIPNVGVVYLSGHTLEDARRLLISKLSLIYRDLISDTPKSFASVEIGNIKAIKVNVVGEVIAPGTYTLPGTASLFNALYICGGPNFNGSFRDIQLLRSGKVEDVLDVYDFLINGNSHVNTQLRDGDVILIPPYKKRVKVGGELKRIGIFECKEGEYISDLIKYAGSFTGEAYTNRLELYRNTDKEKAFYDILKKEFNSFSIEDGDSVFVGKIVERFKNRVEIAGALYRPGVYELKDSLTLLDLIKNAEGLREDAFLNRGVLSRLNRDLSRKNISFNVSDVISGDYNITLEREDIINISSITDLRENRYITVQGEIREAGIQDFEDGLTLSDVIFKAGGLTENASESYVEVSRRLTYNEADQVNDKIAHIFQFYIDRNLALKNEDNRFELMPFDQVFIRKAPSAEIGSTVKIVGEVAYAGVYSLTSKKERISDIIKRAGGLAPNAYVEGATLTRKARVSPAVERLRKSLMENDTTLTFDEVEYEVVGVDLKGILKSPGSKMDIYLLDGDELIIPNISQTVKISGEVLNPLSVAYADGRRCRYYINRGGGFSSDAKKSKLYVLYPNGSASATRNYLFFKSYPKVIEGSEIIVPERVVDEKMKATDWISLASSIASIGMSVALMYYYTKKVETTPTQ